MFRAFTIKKYKAENLRRYYESFHLTLVHGDYKVILFLSSVHKICQLPLMMEIIYLITRKYPLCGYFLCVITHTTASDRHIGGDEKLKRVLMKLAWLCLSYNTLSNVHAQPLLKLIPAMRSLLMMSWHQIWAHFSNFAAKNHW